MQTITFKEFLGVTLQESNAPLGYSRYTKGVDIWGLGNNLKKLSFAGTLQPSPRMLRMQQGSFPFASAACAFAFYAAATGDNRYMYSIDNAAGAGNLYRLSANAGTGTDEWQKVSAITVSGTGANVLAYNGNLHYATVTHVGMYDNVNSNANWNTLTDQASVPRPMKVFSGSLFIGDGRYVAKYDGVTFTATKLTLPDGYLVRSMEVYQDRLYITADNRSDARLIIWDGVSPTYEDFLPIPETYAPSLVVSNGVLWAISNRGFSSSDRVELVNQLYVYSGGNFDQVFLLPVKRSNDFNPPTGFAAYKTGVLVGSSETTTASQWYQEGSAGVWFVGKNADGQYHAGLLMLEEQAGVTGINTHAIFSGQQFVTSASNLYTLPILWGLQLTGAPAAIVDAMDTRNFYAPTATSWQTQVLDGGDSSILKTWHDIKLDIEPDISSIDSVTVDYRLDYATSWTSIKTLTTAATSQMLIPIRKRGRVLEVRITLNASSTLGTRSHTMEVRFDPLQR